MPQTTEDESTVLKGLHHPIILIYVSNRCGGVNVLTLRKIIGKMFPI